MNPRRFPDLYVVDTGTCRPSVRRSTEGLVVIVPQLPGWQDRGNL